MTDEDDIADVVQIHPGIDLADEDRPLASDRSTYHDEGEGGKWCPHRRYRLNDENHRVYCRDCEREVDAYRVLEQLARTPEQYMMSRRGAEARAKAVAERLANLERAERNAKSRRRTRYKREDEGAIAVLRALAAAVPPQGMPMPDAAHDVERARLREARHAAQMFLATYDRDRE